MRHVESIRYTAGTSVERGLRACNPRDRRPWRIGGPRNVRSNLLQGLRLIGQPYEERSPLRSLPRSRARVSVLSGKLSLRLVEARVRSGPQTIVVGPNLAIRPTEIPRRVRDRIDVMTVPSQRVADFHEEACPDLRGRLRVWPAGVDTGWWSADRDAQQRHDVIVYAKHVPYDWLERTESAVKALGQPCRVVAYGHYTHEEYRHALRSAKALISLSPSESQGIALAEAWACGVPTLCPDSRRWRDTLEPDLARWTHSAPYLTPRNGSLLDMDEALEPQIAAFLEAVGTFDPRAEMVERFSLEATAKAYVELFDV